MSNNMTATVDQCMQFNQQPLMEGMQGLLDATVLTTTPTMSSSASNSNSYHTSGHQLTPKGTAFKPIQRRSRASKRTPVTLLNANTSNFRTLVQQFTGCPTKTTMSSPIHKGPITLNFQQGSRKQQIQHHTTVAMSPFGTTSSNQVHQAVVPLPWQNQPEQIPEQQLMQEQQSGHWFDHVKSSNFLPTSGNSYRPSMEVSDGLLFDNDFSLHQQTWNAFSNDNGNGFFM